MSPSTANIRRHRSTLTPTASSGPSWTAGSTSSSSPATTSTTPPLEKPQRIYLVDEDTSGYKKEQYRYTVYAYRDCEAEPLQHIEVDRADKRQQFLTSKYFCLKEEYDYLLVTNSIASGVLVPLFRNVKQGSKVFEFAIDFGTTNTHIEYKSDTDDEAVPFTVLPDDVQVLTLNSCSRRSVEMIDQEGLESFYGGPAQAFMQEFMPLTIGQGEIARFPMRTNLCYRAGHSVEGRDIFPLADYNIGFHYEKEDTYDYNETRPDLKWDSSRGNNLLVEAYFEELLMLIRNKVLLSGGELAARASPGSIRCVCSPIRSTTSTAHGTSCAANSSLHRE